MKQVLRSAVVLLALLACGAVLAQVATAEFLGVDPTAPHSRGVAAWSHDGSVGEVVLTIEARDADGNPVAGAAVAWSVRNTTDSLVFVVGSSAMMGGGATVYNGRIVDLDGGVTDADGRAYLVLDSQTAGDARIHAEVDGVAAETYNGGDIRVVWF